jgi:hypothetical protein
MELIVAKNKDGKAGIYSEIYFNANAGRLGDLVKTS